MEIQLQKQYTHTPLNIIGKKNLTEERIINF